MTDHAIRRSRCTHAYLSVKLGNFLGYVDDSLSRSFHDNATDADEESREQTDDRTKS